MQPRGLITICSQRRGGEQYFVVAKLHYFIEHILKMQLITYINMQFDKHKHAMTTFNTS